MESNFESVSTYYTHLINNWVESGQELAKNEVLSNFLVEVVSTPEWKNIGNWIFLAEEP